MRLLLTLVGPWLFFAFGGIGGPWTTFGGPAAGTDVTIAATDIVSAGYTRPKIERVIMYHQGGSVESAELIFYNDGVADTVYAGFTSGGQKYTYRFLADSVKFDMDFNAASNQVTYEIYALPRPVTSRRAAEWPHEVYGD